MPTEAFFKLEQAKKRTILNAAITEFSAQPYEKVSIFKIAQNAEISRSGFYYYFADKQDLYNYLLIQIKEDFFDSISKTGKKYDLFSFFYLIFDYIAGLKDSENHQLIEKVLYNFKPTDGKEVFIKLQECQDYQELEYLCDLDLLHLETPEEIIGLTFMLGSALLFFLQLYFTDEMDLNESRKRMVRCFDFLKYGVVK